MGKLPYAIKCFEEAVAIDDEPETLSLLATAYTQANRLDDARITLDRMAAKDPEQVNTFLSLAGICYMQEDYEGMNDACQKALALDNKNPLSFYLSCLLTGTYRLHPDDGEHIIHVPHRSKGGEDRNRRGC